MTKRRYFKTRNSQPPVFKTD